jgi:hypothetical protein
LIPAVILFNKADRLLDIIKRFRETNNP